MQTDVRELSDLLVSSLGLEVPPVALRFVARVPAGLRRFEGEVPSACTFWQRAEQGLFFADAPAHLNCLIGMHTMGLPIPAERQPELMGLIGQMAASDYFDASEVPHVPTDASAKEGIVYGPLADFDVTPDAVLLWLTPRQSMLLQEATGAAHWGEGSTIATFGRPSCAAIPAALRRGAATQSLGCVGMRTFTEISDDRLLCVLPKQILGGLAAALERVVRANETMGQYYQQQRSAHSKEVTARM